MTTTTIHAAPIAFSVGKVAELLGCSTDTVRRMISSGRLDAIQPLGKGVSTVRIWREISSIIA